MDKKRFKKIVIDFSYVLIGVVFITISINSFFLKLKIAPGGVSGFATVLYYLTGVPVGTVVFLVNIPLFIIGFITFGKGFSFKTLFATILLSIFLDNSLFLPQFTEDILLASVFGGVIMGIGMAFVFKGNATTGGTDIVAKVVNKFFPAFNISEQLFFIDGLVVIFAMISFKNFDIGLYSIIAIWLSSKIIDIVFEGVGFRKAIFIISDFGDEISEKILGEVKRGVTGIKGEGMYFRNNKKILLTVVERPQIPIIKQLSREIDNRAFIIVTDVREVLGEGFRT